MARGWCKKHHNRWLRHGDPMFVLKRHDRTPQEMVCSAPDCGERMHCAELCSMHYARLSRHGSLEHPHPRRRPPEGMHWCSPCETYKPVADFFANVDRAFGLADDCKDCHRRYEQWSKRHPEEARRRMREWCRANPDKVSENNRRQRLKNPGAIKRASQRRRARKAGARNEDYTPQEIADRDGWRCGICGERIGKTRAYPHPRSLSIDHIVPYADGGDNVWVNVQASHLRCNIRKNARGAGQLRLFG